jgi:hypothetical protein
VTDPDDIDRDTWCTPRAIALAVGPVDLDPCTNERSHIIAARTFRLDRGQDGLKLARYVSKNTRTWINPPYSHGNVIRWVKAYRHTRFTFLVRFDVSTVWWSELWGFASYLCTPKDRVMFEPPPGVEEPPGSPFPHALLYARGEDITPAIRASCYVMRRS